MTSKTSSAIPLILLFSTALLLYLSFQSISLDDFDSVSFALALDHFDISLQQPQPPGFPVYVAMGRVLRALTGDPRTALTLLSAVGGAAGAVALAWLGAEMNNGVVPPGLLAGVGLMTLPGFWLSSEMALSDVPGVALVLLAIVCLWKGRLDRNWLVGGAALAGLCLGLRPQNAIPVVLFGIYAVAELVRAHRQKALVTVIWAVMVGVIAVLLWLIPTVAASGGWPSYWSLVQAQSAHVMQIDSLFGHPINGSTISMRINAAILGLIALVGRNAWAAVAAAVVVLIGLTRVRWRSAPAILCSLWFVVAAAQVFLFESLERPRLYLPFVPPLILLVVLGWSRIPPVRSTTVRIVARSPVLLLSAVFAAIGFPLAATLTREPSPPVQATEYIAAHYPANDTLVVSLGSLRAAQIGLPAYRQLYLGQFDAATWAQTMATRQPVNLVLLDRDDIWPAAYAALTEGSDYVPVEDRLFSRDPRVFPQHSLVRMQVLTPVSLLSPSQLALPPSGEIQVGDSANGKYFGEGWYRAEEIGGVLARWTQQTAVIRVALPPTDTQLTIEAAPYPANQSVTVLVNDQLVGMLNLQNLWEPVTLAIPARILEGHAISTITFRHAQVGMPPGSDRTLAAAYQVIRFRSQP